MRLSVEIDPKFVEQLTVAQTVCLATSGTLATLVLAAWFIPAVGNALPSFWSITKANTALLILATTTGLTLLRPRQGRASRWFGSGIIALVGLLAVLVLVEYLFHTQFRLEFLLPYDHASPTRGRMALPTAINLALLSVVTLLLTECSGILAAAADCIVSVLTVSVLANTSGWIFGATRLFGNPSNTVAPMTMVCLLLLAFVTFGRRAEHGAFAVMLGIGPGSRIARLAFPLALFLPFALEVGREVSVRTMLISPAYASAIATTLAVLLAFCLILLMAWRMRNLEKEIFDLSLRDELTKAYNHRGFFLMAEQALWLARRSGKHFFVLYIDLDGLKAINDGKGHDIGSDFIREAADLLSRVVRRTDTVGRIGGDEFVVAGQSDLDHMQIIVDRLLSSAQEQNALPNRQYPFSFSLGFALSNGDESLQTLIQKADMVMYESKRRKKLAPLQSAPTFGVGRQEAFLSSNAV